MEDSSSTSVPTDRRAEAALCWIAAAELLALILLLAGAIPNVGVLDTVLSVAVPPLLLGAFAVLFTQLRPSVWALLALLFQVVNTTMVLTGDALQHVVFHSTNAAIGNTQHSVEHANVRDRARELQNQREQLGGGYPAQPGLGALVGENRGR